MELTLKERDRLCLLRQAGEGALSEAEAARRLGVTARHFRRLLAKFRLEGDAAAAHGLRGRPSNRALPRSLREKALDMARDPLREDFGPTLLAEHLERETGRRAGVETVRRWMMEAGLWERRRKRAKHRSRRPRRLALGELAQSSGTARSANGSRTGTPAISASPKLSAPAQPRVRATPAGSRRRR